MEKPIDIKVVGAVVCEDCGSVVTEITWIEGEDRVVCAPCYVESTLEE